MYPKLSRAAIVAVLTLLVISPFLVSGKKDGIREKLFGSNPIILLKPADVVRVPKVLTTEEILKEESAGLYESMKLRRYGLTRKAFEYAYRGYKTLLLKGHLSNAEVISICDFSQSSRRKRLYVIDIEEKKVLLNTYVAHGRNSGAEYARSFSNSPESHKSSLGFYVTRQTYFGQFGLALKIDGVESGINNNASDRNIVVHGSNYVGEKFLKGNKFNGRSFGCPAVPAGHTTKLINTIKNGTCLFIYHPTKNYLQKSRLLNG